MSTDDTDYRAQDVRLMGEALGPTYNELSNELTMLCWKFAELSELHGGTGPRLELMNSVAPFFFWLLQETWSDEVLLGITRLLAPRKSAGRENLTFQRLADLISDETLRSSTAQAVEVLVAQSAFVVQWRNKRIAHRDLAHSRERVAHPLPPVSLADVSALLDGLAEALNAILLHYANGTMGYRGSPTNSGVMDLLYRLRDSVRFEEQRHARTFRGEYDPKDYYVGEPPL